MNESIADSVLDYVVQMNAAKSAAGRKKVVDAMCATLGVSIAKAYKLLSSAGWESGRRKRDDRGGSSLCESTLKIAAAILNNSVRKNGKRTMSCEVARAILLENGFDVSVSTGRLRQMMRSAVLDAESVSKSSPYQRMRSEYPNQVHFADPSVALLYFAPGGGQHLLRDDEVYKNKPFLEGKEGLKCWRYVLTDHYSGCICARYYAASGETSANMYDFLLYAWGKKKNPMYVFHGLPELLIWDCGSANVSRSVTQALKALRVETKPHLPGNPRAKGQVENGNNIIETQFECLLRLEEVSSIDELNDAVERWCAAYNANELKYRDTQLCRHGKKIGARSYIWNAIKDSQLRELPDGEICRQIFTNGVQVRKVGGDLSVSVVHPKVKHSMQYSLSGLPNILVGMTVNVQPILVDNDAKVIVSYEADGEIASYEVSPIEFDDAGFDVSSPVFGKEYKSKPDTLRERNAKELVSIAGDTDSKKGVPFAAVTNGEGFKTHSLINAVNPFLSQTVGKQIEIAAGSIKPHEILITAVEAAKRFKARAGYIPEGFVGMLKKEYPSGVPSNIIDSLVIEAENAKDEIKLA